LGVFRWAGVVRSDRAVVRYADDCAPRTRMEVAM
jgi:hypothetical protein